MHSFHWDVKAESGNDNDKTWVKLLGVRSRNHGPKAAITVHKLKADHAVVKDLPEGWKTPEGELYNVLEVLPTATALATGDNGNAKQGGTGLHLGEPVWQREGLRHDDRPPQLDDADEGIPRPPSKRHHLGA